MTHHKVLNIVTDKWQPHLTLAHWGTFLMWQEKRKLFVTSRLLQQRLKKFSTINQKKTFWRPTRVATFDVYFLASRIFASRVTRAYSVSPRRFWPSRLFLRYISERHIDMKIMHKRSIIWFNSLFESLMNCINCSLSLEINYFARRRKCCKYSVRYNSENIKRNKER